MVIKPFVSSGMNLKPPLVVASIMNVPGPSNIAFDLVELILNDSELLVEQRILPEWIQKSLLLNHLPTLRLPKRQSVESLVNSVLDPFAVAII